jgi:hypothetical protein
LNAIFIGWRGETLGSWWNMRGIWGDQEFYFDEAGQVIPTFDEEGNFVPPVNYVRKSKMGLTPGGQIMLPSFDPELMAIAYKSQQFAKPEAKALIIERHQEIEKKMSEEDAKGGFNIKKVYNTLAQKLFNDLVAQDLVVVAPPAPTVEPDTQPEQPAPATPAREDSTQQVLDQLTATDPEHNG